MARLPWVAVVQIGARRVRTGARGADGSGCWASGWPDGRTRVPRRGGAARPLAAGTVAGSGRAP